MILEVWVDTFFHRVPLRGPDESGRNLSLGTPPRPPCLVPRPWCGDCPPPRALDWLVFRGKSFEGWTLSLDSPGRGLSKRGRSGKFMRPKSWSGPSRPPLPRSSPSPLSRLLPFYYDGHTGDGPVFSSLRNCQGEPRAGDTVLVPVH